MANKKCPKCGEDNPAEAVMCWACYTPLAGGAVAATATAGVRPGAPGPGMAPGEEEKKKVDPKMFVVAGLAVVGILVALYTNGVFGGSAPPIDMPITGGGSDSGRPTGGGNTAPIVAPPPPTVNNSGPPIPQIDLPPAKLPYEIAVPPNPGIPTGVVGIVPLQGNISPKDALGLASFARTQLSRSGAWKRMQIYVFANKGAARAFSDYQTKNGRRGDILHANDHQTLATTGLWSSVPACLMTDGGSARQYQPSRNPNAWWPR